MVGDVARTEPLNKGLPLLYESKRRDPTDWANGRKTAVVLVDWQRDEMREALLCREQGVSALEWC